MLDFLRNHNKYEYATKDSRHLCASLLFCVFENMLIAVLASILCLAVIKLFFVLGVW